MSQRYIKNITYQEGYLVEQYIVEKEKDNNDFNFLLYQGTDLHNYYRWRVFAYAQGDTDITWREESFQMYNEGNIWHPPEREKESESIMIKSIYLKIISINYISQIMTIFNFKKVNLK